MYKLSPSDFKYLWEDCKHCYYLKVTRGIQLPSIGMPGIFNKMNGQVQEKAIGMRLQDLHPDLPPGSFEHKEKFLGSILIPPENKCYISGRFDLLTKFDDGTYGIIDLKITDPKDEDLYKFSNQLHAYKFALENPAPGKRNVDNKISKMGLLIISPESVEFNNSKLTFHAQPEWIEIKEDMDNFISFVNEVETLLDGNLPSPTPSCKWCIYRTYFNKPTVSTEDKISF